MPETYGTRPLSWYAEQAPDELWGEDKYEEIKEPNMNDARRKLLTLMIGGCWHEQGEGILCIHCGYKLQGAVGDPSLVGNRPFDTWADLGAVVEAIQRAGKWFSFWQYAYGEWCVVSNCTAIPPYRRECELSLWLFTPSRAAETCDLAAEWAASLKEEERWWVG